MLPRYTSTINAIEAAALTTNYAHPDYTEYKPDWTLVRDCMSGSRRIKDQGAKYLPALDAKTEKSTYVAYKQRAVFTNFVAKTVNGMTGALMSRPVKLLKSSVKTKQYLDRAGTDTTDFNTFCKATGYELIQTGRIGVLVDMPVGGGEPYFIHYIAENILSWETKLVNGKEVPVFIRLREIIATNNETKVTLNGNLTSMPIRLDEQYRELFINDLGQYQQKVYRYDYLQGRIQVTNSTIITPTVRGQPINYIPMIVIGPQSVSFAVQKSPMYDIADLNIAHYQTSAQLEHGRYFTASPVYYVPQGVGGGDGNTEYVIGPPVVWETPPGEKPGILEFYGSGLTQLNASLTEKEEHISQLGGRVMGIRSQASSESEIIYQLKVANELATLTGMAENLSAGMTIVVRWALDWMSNSDATTIKVVFNQDFKAMTVGARELRAVALLYQEGILPISELYRVLQDSRFISDEVDLETFTAMLNDINSFPGQPDAKARAAGYPDVQSKLNDENKDRELDNDEEEIKMKERVATKNANAQAKAKAATTPNQSLAVSQQARLAAQKDRKPPE